MPGSIFEYTDYRAYLRAYHRSQKSLRRGWSYTVWAKQLKLRSPSSLVMILKGQRNPSDTILRHLSNQLKLKRDEAEHLSDLVQLEKKKADPRLGVLLMERIAKRHPAAPSRYVEIDRFQAIANWYYYAIRELARTSGFKPSPTWISRRLRYRVSPEQAREALEVLMNLGLLKRDPESGRVVCADAHVETSPLVASEAVRRFHEQSLENAKMSLRTVGIEGREILGTAFLMPPEALPRAKELLRKFLNEFCDQLESPAASSVFQLELALYPLTRPEEA